MKLINKLNRNSNDVLCIIGIAIFGFIIEIGSFGIEKLIYDGVFFVSCILFILYHFFFNTDEELKLLLNIIFLLSGLWCIVEIILFIEIYFAILTISYMSIYILDCVYADCNKLSKKDKQIINEFKKLKDAEIITEEEYNEKVKNLLGENKNV